MVWLPFNWVLDEGKPKSNVQRHYSMQFKFIFIEDICLTPNQCNELLQRIRNSKSSQNIKLMKLNDCDRLLTECSFILRRLTRLTCFHIVMNPLNGWIFILFLFFSLSPSIVPFCWQSRLNDIQKKKVNFSESVVVLWWHNKIYRLFNTYYSNTMTSKTIYCSKPKCKYKYKYWKNRKKIFFLLNFVMRFCPLIDYFLSAFRIRVMYCGRASLFISRIKWKHTNIVR